MLYMTPKYIHNHKTFRAGHICLSGMATCDVLLRSRQRLNDRERERSARVKSACTIVL